MILDRCPLHTVSRDAIVPSQMKKAELQTWLMDRGIQWEEQWLRARLMQEVERYRDKKPMVEIVAEEKGHKVLFLPVHHPELNPIKLAPCGRTLLVHHMPGAPPTSPSKQSCQRELSHGLCPIPVRSSVWGDTAPGTITPALDLMQFVIDHPVTRVPHLPQDHVPATPSTPQR